MKKLTTMTLAVLAILCETRQSEQPPYQVSLYIHMHPKGSPIHLCNGAIVQSRLVLTSAACVHYQFIPESPMIAVHPTMISVVAGSDSALGDALAFNVSTIYIFDQFNLETLENDLAILRLSASLPLGLRDDMKWIILDDDEFNNNPCVANFFVRNSMDNISNYVQSEELPILAANECTRLSKYPNLRANDICSHYILPLGFDCKDFSAFIPFNGDRGTGLVCNSQLVAVLSTILPFSYDNSTNCSEMSVKAFYTKLGPHLDWIYTIIAEEEYIDVMQDHYSASEPYHQEISAIVETSGTGIGSATNAPAPTVSTAAFPTYEPSIKASTAHVINVGHTAEPFFTFTLKEILFISISHYILF